MRVRGASGRELIPHYYFWANLPTHIKVFMNSDLVEDPHEAMVTMVPGTLEGDMIIKIRVKYCFQNGVAYCINGCRTADTYEQI